MREGKEGKAIVGYAGISERRGHRGGQGGSAEEYRVAKAVYYKEQEKVKREEYCDQLAHYSAKVFTEKLRDRTLLLVLRHRWMLYRKG